SFSLRGAAGNPRCPARRVALQPQRVGRSDFQHAYPITSRATLFWVIWARERLRIRPPELWRPALNDRSLTAGREAHRYRYLGAAVDRDRRLALAVRDRLEVVVQPVEGQVEEPLQSVREQQRERGARRDRSGRGAGRKDRRRVHGGIGEVRV